jgi:hypothetical protein
LIAPKTVYFPIDRPCVSPFAPAEHDGISFIKGTNQGRRAFHVPMKRGEPAARPAGGAGLAGMD